MEDKLADECKVMAKKLARDRSDYDRKLAVQWDNLTGL